MASNRREWLAQRFGLDQLWKHLLARRVAKGAWYFGDGATLVLLFIVLATTGAFMTLTYSASPDAAYVSVRYITERQTLGWLIRGLHYWSAGLMTVMLFFHLFRQILVGGYKPPREGTWLIGVLLFFGVLVMSYTGYVLRWDERAIHALRAALNMFYRVPLVGEYLVIFVQGGREVGAQALTRIYSVHVIFVPLILSALTGYHLYLVILHGITSPTERKRHARVATAEEQKKIYKEDAESEKRGEIFYPETTAKSGAMALIIFAVAVALALVYGPRELMPEANLVERSLPAEEWWYWWYSGLIALLPPAVAPAFVVVFPIVLFVVLVALPFLDRRPYRGILNRPVWAVVVAACVLGLFFLSDYRRRSPFTGWPESELPPVPPGTELTEEAARGRRLFVGYGCTSCHAIAGHGRKVGPDLAELRRRLSQDELREYILNPPEGVPMPSYEGRIPEDDLDRVVAFVLVAQTFPEGQR